jgi:hypothetical protein
MARGCPTALVFAALFASACHSSRPPGLVMSEGQPDPEAATPPPEEPEASAAPEPEAAQEEEEPGAPAAADGGAVATHYAALGRETCVYELKKWGIAFTRVEEARGVVAPLRLDGPLSGVKFRSNLPASKARTSPYDVYDCRLVLALDDFAKLLAKHDIVEVMHLSVWRPVSSKTTLKGPGRRHTGALAIDAAIFKTSDGKSLSVEKDFHGRIGAKPCPAPENATELRKIACEASQARLFNVLLTPDYNWAHRNHFHLEVTANVKWTLVR